MTTWDVTVTLDLPTPDEPLLAEILDALPRGATAGRSPWSEHLRVTVEVRGDVDPLDAARAVAVFVVGALDRDSGNPVRVLGVEVLADDETERRSPEPRPLDLVSTDEAAELLHLKPARVRQLAQAGELGAVKVGDAGWVFPRRAVEAEARRRGVTES